MPEDGDTRCHLPASLRYLLFRLSNWSMGISINLALNLFWISALSFSNTLPFIFKTIVSVSATAFAERAIFFYESNLAKNISGFQLGKL